VVSQTGDKTAGSSAEKCRLLNCKALPQLQLEKLRCDVLLLGPGMHCSPRHRMPCNSNTWVESALCDVSSDVCKAVPSLAVPRSAADASAQPYTLGCRRLCTPTPHVGACRRCCRRRRCRHLGGRRGRRRASGDARSPGPYSSVVGCHLFVSSRVTLRIFGVPRDVNCVASGTQPHLTSP
jgi:hypothetical protein